VSLRQAFSGRNPALRYVLAGVAAVSAIVLLMGPIREFLKFGTPHLHDLAIVPAVGVILFLALEFLKPFATGNRHEIHRHAHAQSGH
jgi:hypothetical protein